MSKEHAFTRGMWPGLDLTVSGGPFGDGRSISLDNYVVKSLCAVHNTALSHLDMAGIDFVNACRLIRMRGTRKDKPRVKLRVDGWRIERWLLKTMASAGMMMKSDLPSWAVPTEMAQHIFGAQALPAGAGLYLFAGIGDKLQLGQDAAHILFTADGNAAQIELWGVPFLVSLVPLTGRFASGQRVYQASELVYRPKRLDSDNVRLEWLWEPLTNYKGDAQLKAFRRRFRPPKR